MFEVPNLIATKVKRGQVGELAQKGPVADLITEVKRGQVGELAQKGPSLI